MEDFIAWLFNSFKYVIMELTSGTLNLIDDIFNNMFEGNDGLSQMSFNLSLFSDIPILTTNVYDFLLIVFSILYTVIFVVIVWKIMKWIFKSVFKWGRFY